MVEGSGWRFPWGTVWSCALLAAILTGALRTFQFSGELAAWSGIGALMVAAVSAFAAMRWLVSWLTGMIAALCIALSSPFVHAARDGLAVLPEGLVLFAFVCVLAGWRNLAPSRNHRSGVGEVFLWLAVAAGALAAVAFAWSLHPRNGLAAALLVLLGLAFGAVTAARVMRGGVPGSWMKVVAAAVMALLTPVGGLFAATLIAPQISGHHAHVDAIGLLRQAIEIKSSDFAGSISTQVNPTLFWLILALSVWGTWRSVRHGFVFWRAQKLPISWLLPLYAIINLALLPQSDPETSLLPMVTSGVLLAVFGIGDFFRGIGQRLILKPPHERTE